MKVVDAFYSPEAYTSYGIDFYESGKQSGQSHANIPIEGILHVYINNTLFMDITCSPDNLFELTLGRLFSEGIISTKSDIDDIRFEKQSMRMFVALKNSFDKVLSRTITMVSTCESNKQTLSNLNSCSDLPKKVEPIPWDIETIFRLAKVFARDTPGHRTTYGLHSCYLVVGENVLFCCEDLGRHNALDKVIGHALEQGIDFRQTLVFTSGRTPVDMVSKVIRAHIPILVTKAVPTYQSVALAQSHELTLICSAYPDSIKVFSDPEGKYQQANCKIAV